MSNPTGWDAPKPEVPDDPALGGPAHAVPDQAPDGFTPAELATPESDSLPEVISSDLAPRLALDDADPGAPEATDFAVGALPERAIDPATEANADLLRLPDEPAAPSAPAAPSYTPQAASYPPPSAPYGGDYTQQAAGQAYGTGAAPAPEPGGNYAAPGFPNQPMPYPPQPGYGYPPAIQQGGPDTTAASMSHWLGILVGFLGPLIIMLTKGEQDQFVKANAVEALNFQITLAIGYVASFLLTFVLIGIIGYIVLPIIGIVYSVLGALAANKGQVYRYPFSIRLVK
ncbi:MAG: DUF4870 domain-containing protein [Propionicimonas sp.]